MQAGVAGLAVAITVDRGNHPRGRYAFGSGCLIGSDTVLTAAHVIADAVTVSVRTADFTTYSATVNPAFTGDPGTWNPDKPRPPDLALLTLDNPVEVSRLPVARVDRGHPAGLIDRVRTVGYPGFGETDTEAKDTVRVQVPAAGQLLLSDREDGLLDFQVTVSPPSPHGTEGSQWQGMSGAPVLASGWLIGVITEHAPRKGPSNVAIIPLNALQSDPEHPSWGTGVTNPEAWWGRLGIDPADVAVVPTRREAAYRATLREFGRALHQRMPELVGREEELAEIAAFATSAEPYRWLVGGAYAGKSALLFEAATAGVLPDTVDAVCYFLTRRSSDATADRFLAAVVPQLEVLLDWPHETPDQYRFDQTWEEATAAARRIGRHLLLIVDALDEDLHPPAAPWVTDILPAITGPNGHVLVSSRPYPQIPDRVPGTHPLKTCPEIHLQPFKGSAELAELAKSEIDALASDDDLDVDVLGLLTAAGGPLSLMDLAALHAHPGPPTAATRTKLRYLLTNRGARSLEPVGSHDAPRYQFAHELLAEHARTNLDLADAEYRERIHDWAGGWAHAGWPDPQPDGSGTPRYLLDTYPTTLLGDATGPGSLPPHPVGWVDVAIRVLGVDPTLDALRAAQPHARKSVAPLYATVAAQLSYLRPPQPVDQRGYVLRHLCLQAMRFGKLDLADELRARLTTQSGDFIPEWTSSRLAPPALDLGSHDGEVSTVAVLPDGRVVTGGLDRRVRIWHPDHPGIPFELGRLDGLVFAVAVLPDGRVVTGDGYSRVRIWDPDHPAAFLELGTNVGYALTVLPDGRVVTGGDDGGVRIWDPDHPGTPLDIGIHEGTVYAVASLPDGRVVSGAGDNWVRIWDPDHPGTPLDLGTHNGPVSSLAILPDGRVATGGEDGLVRIWDPDHPGTPLDLSTHDNGVNVVNALTALPGGRLVTGGEDGRVRIWDPDHPATPLDLGSHDSRVDAVATLPDGRLVTGGEDGRVRIWDPDHPATPLDLGTHDSRVDAVATLPDRRLVTGSTMGRVRIWDPDEPGTPLELGTHDGRVLAVDALPDGRLVTGGGDHRVRIWTPDHPGTPLELGTHDGRVLAVAVLPDGRVVTGGGDHRVRIWNPDHPGTALELGTHDGRVAAVAVLPDGRVVTGGSDLRIRIWKPDHPGTPLELGTHDDLKSVTVLSDGRWIARTGGRVRIWHPDRPGTALDRGNHDDWVPAVAVLPDGRVVTGGWERVRIWHPDRPGKRIKLGTHGDPVFAVAVLPDGRVATGGWDRVRIWNPDHPGKPVLDVNEAVTALAASRYAAGPQHLVLAGNGLTLLRLGPSVPPPTTSGLT